MFINSDNGANIKRALLDLSELEQTVRDEPMVEGEVEDDDDWTNNSSDMVQGEPLSVMVKDEFLPIPIGLGEENWDEGDYTDVDQVVKNLHDEITHLRKNPRLHSLSRLPCFCHLLQVKHRSDIYCDRKLKIENVY